MRHEAKAESSHCHHSVVCEGESDDEDWLRTLHHTSASSSMCASSGTGGMAEEDRCSPCGPVQDSGRVDAVLCTDACCADIDEYGRELLTVPPLRVEPVEDRDVDARFQTAARSSRSEEND